MVCRHKPIANSSDIDQIFAAIVSNDDRINPVSSRKEFPK